ncbi:MAG: hypothetical protein C0497_06040 [Gemmatimonas sp.]|nr:hypothetical protein [Gemmatimonas sp.]
MLRPLPVAYPLADDVLEAFVDLAISLCPEHLSRDGELSPTTTRRRARVYQRAWAALERQIGFRVSEDTVWAMREARQQQEFEAAERTAVRRPETEPGPPLFR